MSGLSAVNPFMREHSSTWNLSGAFGVFGGFGGLFGESNPYLQQFGSPWQQQLISTDTTVATTTAGLSGPPLTLTADPELNCPQFTQEGVLRMEEFLQAQENPNDWTAWPVTKSFVAWYRRVDKVEFWASVVIFGYYVAHCVLGVL